MQSFSNRLQATACTYICGIVLEDLDRPVHSWEWWNTNTWCHEICGKTCQAIWGTLAAINSSVDISHRKVMSKPDSSLKWLFSYLRIKVPDASYEFTLYKSYHSKKNMCQRPLSFSYRCWQCCSWLSDGAVNIHVGTAWKSLCGRCWRCLPYAIILTCIELQ